LCGGAVVKTEMHAGMADVHLTEKKVVQGIKQRFRHTFWQRDIQSDFKEKESDDHCD
jgi:hypothetical protein